ncbi:MAG: gliding motility-associated C-terminal domain-containing protein [Bacteroidota bacterium]
MKGYSKPIKATSSEFLFTGGLPMPFSVQVLNKFMLSFILLSLSTFSFGQSFGLWNKGLTIVNTDIIFVLDGNIIHQDNGAIDNGGHFFVKGDWTNDNPSGNVCTAGNNGWIHLNGAMQTIGGSTLTHFNNLELLGTGIKQLGNVDTEIEDTLSLNDIEFATGDNTASVIATGADVVTRTNGFVSSTNDGGLARNTLATNTYFFPVGSSTGTLRFRPVDITPNSSSANTFKVRMANVEPGTEGFSRASKEVTIGEINPFFYHRINRTSGTSPADITLYYDNTEDGDYDIIARWQNLSQWGNLAMVSTTSNYGFSGITKQGVADFSATPFALAEVAPSVLIPNVFSPNGDGYNDLLGAYGKGITQIEFVIYDRWGEKVYESYDVNGEWDGTYKGKPMNIGVFVYSVKGKFKNGEIFDKKGNVTLLR